MKTKFSHLSMVVAALLCFVAGAAAQNDILRSAAGDKYVISAKAGGVNFLEGTVDVVRTNGRSGRLLKGDSLQVGDRVTTGADGKVEILLNPGSYLRLGGDSSFSFKTTSLDDLNLEVKRGSAILEVFAAEDFKVTVVTPNDRFVLVKTGVYRVDVPETGTARLEVWKGKALVGDEMIKSGKSAVAGSTGVEVAKFDRDDKDALEIWSKSRSKELAKVTASLQRNDMRTALMQSFLGRRWNVYNSFGLWVYDPFGGSYCFLPFGYGWSSPYGYGYGRYLGWYNMPWVVYMPPVNQGGGGSGSGGATTPQPHTIWSAGDRTPTPPFVRMQTLMGTGRNNTYSASDAASPSAFPSSAPSAPAASMPAARAPKTPKGP